ncbi:MAG: YfjI family protein [Steroidobacteraceae bacterium]
MSAAAAPTPDRAEIAHSLGVLHPDGVIEVRALYQRGRKRTAAGYFDGEHREELIEQAAKLNEQGAAVYVVMNPLDPQLLARYANRIEDYAQATAADANITWRRWLLIDVDPQRPKDTSATQEQLEAAMSRARKVYGELAARGWPKPVVADSGNGAHLLYSIELPNDDAARDLVKGCLEALAAKFDDGAVKIDRSVFNAARIVKLHGTVATKGDNIESAPWRLSKLRNVPEQIETVSVELLRALAAEAPSAERPRPNGHERTHSGNGRAWSETDVSDFLRRGGIESISEPAPHDGATRWRLRRCPFNPEHGPTESAVFLQPDGRLGFHCSHNSCADKHWQNLRELVDGPRERSSRSSGSSREGMSGVSAPEPTPLLRPLPPATPYPVDALGPVLGPAVRAMVEIVQVPEALAAGCVLATAALAAQRQANVQTLGGARPLSLFVLTVAGSGDRKTAADDVALSPVREHMKRMTLSHRAQMQEWERARDSRKLDRTRARREAQSGGEYAAALRDITDGPQPRRPWLICSEPTPEGLVRSLADGQYGQGIFTDEGGQFLGGHALSQEAELRTIALLSRAWQGSPLDRVRATDREHLVLYGRRLSMHLLAQPEVATRMLGSSLYRSQGWLARWLIAAPESLAGTRLHDASRPAPQEDSRVRRYHHGISELLERPAVEDHEVGGLDPPCLALSVEARALLVSAYDEVETAQARDGELEGLRDWASKAAEHACRIAGVLTLVAEPAAVSVSGDSMRGALLLMQHYLGEYTRLIGFASVPEHIQHAQILLEWVRRRPPTPLTPRYVMQYGPRAAGRSAEAVKAALRALAENGWLLTEDHRTYTVHPAAFAKAAS